MSAEVIHIYSDGACKGNPGAGGWGALLVAGGHRKEIFGGEPDTTNNRMEMTAVIQALELPGTPIRSTRRRASAGGCGAESGATGAPPLASR